MNRREELAKAWDDGVTAGVGWVNGKPDPVNPYLQSPVLCAHCAGNGRVLGVACPYCGGVGEL